MMLVQPRLDEGSRFVRVTIPMYIGSSIDDETNPPSADFSSLGVTRARLCQAKDPSILAPGDVSPDIGIAGDGSLPKFHVPARFFP